jgi:hypothetical protein
MLPPAGAAHERGKLADITSVIDHHKLRSGRGTHVTSYGLGRFEVLAGTREDQSGREAEWY